MGKNSKSTNKEQLNKIIEEKKVYPVYQPIVSLKTGEIMAMKHFPVFVWSHVILMWKKCFPMRNNSVVSGIWNISAGKRHSKKLKETLETESCF